MNNKVDSIENNNSYKVCLIDKIKDNNVLIELIKFNIDNKIKDIN